MQTVILTCLLLLPNFYVYLSCLRVLPLLYSCPIPTCKAPKRKTKRLRPLPTKLADMQDKESILEELRKCSEEEDEVEKQEEMEEEEEMEGVARG